MNTHLFLSTQMKTTREGDLPLLGNLCFCTRCFLRHQLRNSAELLKQTLTDPRVLQGHSCCQGAPCSGAVPCRPTASGSCTGRVLLGRRGGCRGDSRPPPHTAVRCPQLLRLHCSVLISPQRERTS